MSESSPPIRRNLSESEWRKVVSKLNSSGLSQREFSKREGVVKSQLYYWSTKFKRESSSEGQFIEFPPPAPSKGTLEVELELSNGTFLRLRS